MFFNPLCITSEKSFAAVWGMNSAVSWSQTKKVLLTNYPKSLAFPSQLELKRCIKSSIWNYSEKLKPYIYKDLAIWQQGPNFSKHIYDKSKRWKEVGNEKERGEWLCTYTSFNLHFDSVFHTEIQIIILLFPKNPKIERAWRQM